MTLPKRKFFFLFSLLTLISAILTACSNSSDDESGTSHQANQELSPPQVVEDTSNPNAADEEPISVGQIQALKAETTPSTSAVPYGQVNPVYKYENQLVLPREDFVVDEKNPSLSGRTYFMQFYILNESDLSYYSTMRGMTVKLAYQEGPHDEGDIKIITQDDLDASMLDIHLGLAPMKTLVHLKTIPHPKHRKQVVATCFGGAENLYNQLLRSSLTPGHVGRISDIYTCNADFTAQTNLNTQEILIKGSLKINHEEIKKTSLNVRSLDTVHYAIVLTPYPREHALIPHLYTKSDDASYLCGDTLYSAGHGGYVNYTLRRNLAQAPFYYYFAPHFPQRYKAAVADAITYWNQVFGKTVLVLLGELPANDNQALNILSLHNNIIQWDERPHANHGAYSTVIHDPANGEILKNIITLHLDDLAQNIAFMVDYYRTKRLQKIPLYPFGPHAVKALDELKDGKDLGEYQKLFSEAVQDQLAKQIMADNLRETVAHELGHSFGLGHNFAGNIAGNLTPEKVFPLMNTYITLLTDKIMPLPAEYQPSEEAINDLRQIYPGSTVMDYYGNESDILLGQRIRWLAQDIQAQVPAAQRLTVLPYDKAAIDQLYNDKTDAPAYPYCSDEEADKNLLDCRRHDQFNHPVDFQLWQVQRLWMLITHNAQQITQSDLYLNKALFDLLEPIAELGELLNESYIFKFPNNPALYGDGNGPLPDKLPPAPTIKEMRLKWHHLDLANIFFGPILIDNNQQEIPFIHYLHKLMSLWGPLSSNAEKFFKEFKFSSSYFSVEYPVFSAQEFGALIHARDNEDAPAALDNEEGDDAAATAPDVFAEEVPTPEPPAANDNAAEQEPEKDQDQDQDQDQNNNPLSKNKLMLFKKFQILRHPNLPRVGHDPLSQEFLADESSLLAFLEKRLADYPLQTLYFAWMIILKDLQFKYFMDVDYAVWIAGLHKLAKLILLSPGNIKLPFNLPDDEPINAYFPYYPMFFVDLDYKNSSLKDVYRNLMIDLIWQDYFGQPAYMARVPRHISTSLVDDYAIIMRYLKLLHDNFGGIQDPDRFFPNFQTFLQREEDIFKRLRTLPDGTLLPIPPEPIQEMPAAQENPAGPEKEADNPSREEDVTNDTADLDSTPQQDDSGDQDTLEGPSPEGPSNEEGPSDDSHDEPLDEPENNGAEDLGDGPSLPQDTATAA